MKSTMVVCCSSFRGKDWGWFKDLTEDETDWVFYDDHPAHFWEIVIPRPNLATIRSCLECVVNAARGKATLLIAITESIAFWCCFFCRILRFRIPIYVHSFNYPTLPTGLKRRIMAYAFERLSEVSVHSTVECDLYSEYFGIPRSRIRLRLWSVAKLATSPSIPSLPHNYISSVGGNHRDYRILIEASLLIPDIPMVLVARPENLKGLTIPRHVQVFINRPAGETMNILQRSAFTVVPLDSATAPCGQATLVLAMHLGKAIVATDSEGISDYLIDGYNGVRCVPFSHNSMADAIARLWGDPQEVARLGDNALQFARKNCSEAKQRADFAATLSRWNLPLRKPVPPTELSAAD